MGKMNRAEKRVQEIGSENIKEWLVEYEGLHYHKQTAERKALRINAMKSWGLKSEDILYITLRTYRAAYGDVKVCPHCKKEVSAQEKEEGKGYHLECAREIARANSRRSRAALLTRTKAGEQKRCESCQKNLPVIKFSGDASEICISCRHILSVNFPQTEEEINLSKAARVMAPRIAKTKAGQKIARNWRGKALVYEDLFIISKNICICCGETMQLWQIIEIDHIVALELGGLHNRLNLAPMHRHCNQFKGSFDVLAGELGPEIKDRAENAINANRKYYAIKEKTMHQL